MSRPTAPAAPHPERAAFLAKAIDLIHTPYIWGGRSVVGVDCWGLVAFAYKEAGGSSKLLNWWTDIAWNTLVPVPDDAALEPGDLAFYGGTGPLDVDHVMIWLCGLVFGASGGSQSVKTATEAAKRGARVKVYPSLKAYNASRGDFRGYRRLPFKED